MFSSDNNTKLLLLYSFYCVLFCLCSVSGEMPLRDDIRKRLRRIKATLINMLYTNDELLDYLIGERVISEADNQNIGAELTLNQKNARLIEIIMRGSERNLQCFKDVLTFVGQGHVVKYIEKG